MQLQNEVKQALKELPPAQRVVAFALKNIYEKIKGLHQKEQKQIDNNRNVFVQKQKNLQQNAGTIIQGRKLKEQQLAKPDLYFVEEQKNDIKLALESGALIKDYWLVSLKNSFIKKYITEKDQKILSCLQNIQSKVTQNTIQISLKFTAGSQVEARTYNRTLQLNNGAPFAFKGDKLITSDSLTQGVVFLLFSDTNSETELYTRFQIIVYIVNNIIPYSLRYFLGEVEDWSEEDQQGDEEDEDSEEESQQNENSRKKKN